MDSNALMDADSMDMGAHPQWRMELYSLSSGLEPLMRIPPGIGHIWGLENPKVSRVV